jgi:hypothetical protein
MNAYQTSDQLTPFIKLNIPESTQITDIFFSTPICTSLSTFIKCYYC